MLGAQQGKNNSLNSVAKYPRRGKVMEAYPNVHIPSASSSRASIEGRVCTTKSILLGSGVTIPQNLVDAEVRQALQKLRQRKSIDFDEDDANDDDALLCLNTIFELKPTDKKACLTLTNYKGTGDGSVEAQINQDRAFVSTTQTKKWNLVLGVFDGHGDRGEEVAQYCVTELMDLLPGKLPPKSGLDEDSLEDEKHVKQALINAFLEINLTLPSKAIGGSTASVLLQRNKKIYAANLGDSRSFIATHSSKTKEVKVLYITAEHLCHLPEERARIESKGGEVVMVDTEGDGDSRIYYLDPSCDKKKSIGMSRSIGDWDAKPFGVSADPTVDVVTLDPAMFEEDCHVKVFAVSASDGIFNFLDYNDIAARVAKSLYDCDDVVIDHPLQAAEELIVKAAQGWSEKYNGGRDDITIAFCDIPLPQMH